MSRIVGALPAIVAFGAVVTILYALRFGVFPLYWTPRTTRPRLFWLQVALAAAAGLGAAVWTVRLIVQALN